MRHRRKNFFQKAGKSAVGVKTGNGGAGYRLLQKKLFAAVGLLAVGELLS
jgi:hypothetical protein